MKELLLIFFFAFALFIACADLYFFAYDNSGQKFKLDCNDDGKFETTEKFQALSNETMKTVCSNELTEGDEVTEDINYKVVLDSGLPKDRD